MGSLNRRHERLLYTAIEDPKRFGRPVTLYSPSGERFTGIHGQVTQSMREMDNFRDMGDAVGMVCAVALRLSTLRECVALWPAEGWQLRMPGVGWIFEIEDEKDCEVRKYIVEDGGVHRDRSAGIWVFVLTDYEEQQ